MKVLEVLLLTSLFTINKEINLKAAFVKVTNDGILKIT